LRYTTSATAIATICWRNPTAALGSVPSRTAIRRSNTLIRTHPDTGRKALFVNRVFTAKIVELGDRESRDMLDLLFAHAEQPAFQVRYHWSVRDRPCGTIAALSLLPPSPPNAPHHAAR
jgi:hypothetical protein